MSKEVSTQAQNRNTEARYDPNRSYWMSERDSNAWQGHGEIEAKLDERLPNGDKAYRVEADGANPDDIGGYIGTRRAIMLSCPKEHADAKIKAAEDESARRMGTIMPIQKTGSGVELYEEVKIQDPIKVIDAIDKSQIAKAELDAAKNS